MGTVFPAMAGVYHYQLSVLGFFTSSFLLGAGLFQIPAGIYSARHGATRAAIFGLAVLAVTSGLSAYSGEFYIQLALRFLAGMAAAFYFAPGLAIASSALRQRSGLASGIYGGMFYLGGGLASIAFTPIASSMGWRVPFIIVSILTFIALGENVYAFKGYSPTTMVGSLEGAYRTLRSRNVLFVTIAILGVGAINYIITQFFVTYTEEHLGYSAAAAGTISSLFFVGAFFGGPVGGWLSDHFKERRRLFILLPAIGAAVSVALFSIAAPVALLAGAIASGLFVSAAYANAYAFPTQLRIGRDYAALSIGLINSSAILYRVDRSTGLRGDSERDRLLPGVGGPGGREHRDHPRDLRGPRTGESPPRRGIRRR